jgi:hypothetical protein
MNGKSLWTLLFVTTSAGIISGCAGSNSSHDSQGHGKADGDLSEFTAAAEAAVSNAFARGATDTIDPTTAPASVQSLFGRYSSDVTQVFEVQVEPCTTPCQVATQPVYVVEADEDLSVSVFDQNGAQLTAGKLGGANLTQVTWQDRLIEDAEAAVGMAYANHAADQLNPIDPTTAPGTVQELFNMYSSDVTAIYAPSVSGKTIYVVAADEDSSITLFDAAGSQLALGKLNGEQTHIDW